MPSTASSADYFLGRRGQPPERPVLRQRDQRRRPVRRRGTRRRYPKDGIDRAVVQGDPSAVNPSNSGTKAAFWYRWDAVAPGETVEVRLRLRRRTRTSDRSAPSSTRCSPTGERRPTTFYAAVIHPGLSDEDRHIARRAYAGLLWAKQLYRYDVDEWLDGDPADAAATGCRGTERDGRNTALAPRGPCRRHLHAGRVGVPLVRGLGPGVPRDSRWPTSTRTSPRNSCVLMCREWAMHPNGQLPAYEWEFGDVNPPVHAWAAWHVYRIDGYRDRDFLIRVFTKLLLNFSWWVNRKDADGLERLRGRLPRDGQHRRVRPVGAAAAGLPAGAVRRHRAGWRSTASRCSRSLSSWPRHDQAWDDMATKFLEHFLSIAEAMNSFGSHGRVAVA